MKLLLGFWIVQALTAGLVVLALRPGMAGDWPLFVALAAVIGAVAAMAFGTLAHKDRRLGEAELRARHEARARDLQLSVEKARAQAAERISAVRAQAQSSRSGRLKAGAVAGAVAGVGLTLVIGQFVALGLAAIAFAAGAAGGYTLRGLPVLRRGGETLPTSPAPTKLVKADRPEPRRRFRLSLRRDSG